MKQPRVAVIGDGWSALAAIGFLANTGRRLTWISGSGARLTAPLASLEAGPGVVRWKQLADRLGVEVGEPETGSYLREFRNKSFRPPTWTRSPTPELRREVRDENVWEPEQSIAAPFEARFSLPLGELEEKIRASLLAMKTKIRRLEGIPVAGFRLADDGKALVLVLGSGEELECDQVIYADRWLALLGIEGMLKPVPFLRGRDWTGVLQATFTHSSPIGADVLECFYGTIQRESGEEMQRHVWGYFLDQGKRSVWSIFINQDETEDNHAIAKKFRRLKQALDKMFTGTCWIPEGTPDFLSSIESESVRFEENILCAAGKPLLEPLHIKTLPGLDFVTDGYGPSCALAQVGALLAKDLGLGTGEVLLEPIETLDQGKDQRADLTLGSNS